MDLKNDLIMKTMEIHWYICRFIKEVMKINKNKRLEGLTLSSLLFFHTEIAVR